MKKQNKKIISGFKAYNKGLECNGFKYEEGKEYVHEGKLELCQSGFHFCENPLDTLNYYDLCESEFTTVESLGDTDKKDGENEDSKVVTNHIKIGAKIDLSTFIKASVYFLFESTGHKTILDKAKEILNIKSSGYSAQLASSGYSAQLASSGYSAQLASSGDYAKLASSGDSAKLASSGDSAKLASSGDYAKLASSGYSAKLASSGDSAKLASSGYSAKLASSGYSAKLAVNGKDSIGAGIGVENIIKGKKGNWIVLAEWKDNKPVCVKTAQIDGKILKEDTYYKLVDGEFKEVN